RANGPSIMRMLRCNLNGQRFCARSSHPLLRTDKREFFERRVRAYAPMLRACIELAPSDEVRGSLRELEREIAETLGPPTDARQTSSGAVGRPGVGGFERGGTGDPPLMKDEFRRYVYADRHVRPTWHKPYAVAYPRRGVRERVERAAASPAAC